MASIKEKGNSIYVIYDYTDINGQRKQKRERCQSMEQAQVRKAEVDLDKARNDFIVPDAITVAGFFQKWIPVYARNHWSFKTYATKLCLIDNHILPHIGDVELQKLTTEHLDTLYDTLQKKEKRVGANCHKKPDELVVSTPNSIVTGAPVKKNTLSMTTIKEVHDILRCALSKAVEWKHIRESPLPKEGPKKQRVQEQPVWSESLMDKALHNMSKPMLHLAVHCAFWGCLRNGEATAITRDCIDLNFKDKEGNLIGRILINKTLQQVSKEALAFLPQDSILYVFPTVMEDKKSCMILKDPKTPKSRRFIYLNAQLRQEIAAQLERIETNRMIYGQRYGDHDLLICLPNGNPIEPKLLEKWFKDWQKENGTNYPDLVFHGLRHSSATYKSGISLGDMNLIQKEGGWVTAEMASHYTHIDESDRIALADKMEKDFYKVPTAFQQNAPPTDLLNALLEQMKTDPQLQKNVFSALFAQAAQTEGC